LIVITESGQIKKEFWVRDDAMEANDAADIIQDTAAERDNAFKHHAAITIAIFSLILAITSLGGSNSSKDMLNSNIEASNLWSFYQAKNSRQTETRLAKERLEIQLITATNQKQREMIETHIKKYDDAIKRYESEPSTGEGKVELVAKAKKAEALRDQAIRQDPYFDLAGALLQIAIVLCSVSILSASVMIYRVSIGLALLGALLSINGFTLIVAIPFMG
jgi:hypothetical protein